MKAKNNLMVLICIFIQFASIENVKYQKNIDIISKYKGIENPRQIIDINTEYFKFYSSDYLIIYYNQNCIMEKQGPTLCKELFSTMNEILKYQNFLNFEFYRINCSTLPNEICNSLSNHNFPYVEIIFNNKYIPYSLDQYNLESILEFLDKLSSPDIIELHSTSQIHEFSKNYGYFSFVLIDDENNFYTKCYKEYASNEKYKPLYYFAKLSNQNYPNLPLIASMGVNEQFNIFKSLPVASSQNLTQCDILENFIIKNSYPFMEKFNENYLKRIVKDKLFLFVLIINKNNNLHTDYLKLFSSFAYEHDFYKFSYMYFNENNIPKLLFNKENKGKAIIIIYNGQTEKFIDDSYDMNLNYFPQFLDSALDKAEILWLGKPIKISLRPSIFDLIILLIFIGVTIFFLNFALGYFQKIRIHK